MHEPKSLGKMIWLNPVEAQFETTASVFSMRKAWAYKPREVVKFGVMLMPADLGRLKELLRDVDAVETVYLRSSLDDLINDLVAGWGNADGMFEHDDGVAHALAWARAFESAARMLRGKIKHGGTT